jgi:hypothetical protein
MAAVSLMKVKEEVEVEEEIIGVVVALLEIPGTHVNLHQVYVLPSKKANVIVGHHADIPMMVRELLYYVIAALSPFILS